MEEIRWSERMKVHLLGASNTEDVNVTWITKILDDGYVVHEMETFEIIARGSPQ